MSTRAPSHEHQAPRMRTGVLVMAYGTPATPADIEPYYTHIRRGRPPTEEQLGDLVSRYAAIGGISQLAAHTEAQRAALAARLEASQPGRFAVGLGQKHAFPFVEDGVDALVAEGVDHLIGVVLAPHYSGFSIGQYAERARAQAATHGIDASCVERWADLPAFVDHQAASLRDRLTRLPSRTKVVFTAHSLPERVLVDDPYPDELHRSAAAIAAAAGLGSWSDWGVAWQSAGRTPEPWRGPDILDVIDDLASTGSADGVIVVPQGFTSDHLEVVYDLDIEAAARAEARGLAFARTDVVGADPAVMSALADRVAELADDS